MGENVEYKKALCEVDYILENTDRSLISMIPMSFLKWVKENKLTNYKTTILNNIPLEEQTLQPETEAIISLIFRKYWSNDEEKRKFAEKDKNEFINNENIRKEQYPVDIVQMLKNNRKSKELEQNTDLIEIIPEFNFFRKIINKIKSFFKR